MRFAAFGSRSAPSGIGAACVALAALVPATWPGAGHAELPTVIHPGSPPAATGSHAASGVTVITPGGAASGGVATGKAADPRDLAGAGAAYVDFVRQALRSVSTVADIIGRRVPGGAGASAASPQPADASGLLGALSRLQSAMAPPHNAP